MTFEPYTAKDVYGILYTVGLWFIRDEEGKYFLRQDGVVYGESRVVAAVNSIRQNYITDPFELSVGSCRL